MSKLRPVLTFSLSCVCQLLAILWIPRARNMATVNVCSLVAYLISDGGHAFLTQKATREHLAL